MPKYRRNRIDGGTYFFTVNLMDRRSTLLTDHIATLREVVKTTHQKKPFHIDAWVMLPEHMHCIWTLPQNDNDYPARWQAIKKAFSKAIPKTESLSAVRMSRSERGIWQRRYWEHTIRNDAGYAAHMDYVHFNPLKHGLVKRVRDWPYSSYHGLVAKGVYPEDWAGEGEVDLEVGEQMADDSALIRPTL